MDNLNFKLFLEEDDFLGDVKKTIKKIPKSHQYLVKNYDFTHQKGNTLKGDEKHVGEIDEKKSKITLAAPWHYSREFVALHEIAHAVYKYVMTPKLKEEWNKIFKNTKKDSDSLNQPAEEIFAMSYATVYCKHPPTTYAKPAWLDFIKKLPN